ncbi:MAG: sugar ABC transporter permease [Catenulispora sp.]|nr:sugar ABC transporter permease [Catenulispora sp.]
MSVARPRRSRSFGIRAVPFAAIAPAAILFVAFFAAPIGFAVYMSLRGVHVKGLGLDPHARTENWVGTRNYSEALGDSELWHGVLRTLAYGAFLLPVMLGLALLFALLLDSARARLTRFARLAIFLPYAVPVVIASLLWGFLYLPTVSPFQPLFQLLGVQMPNVLSNSTILFSVANVGIWGGTGYNMIVIYTALRALPEEVYEAARLDGCSELAIALRVKVPMVTPALVLTGLFSIIATLQVFSEPTTLMPIAKTISTTWTPLMKVYNDAFGRNDLYGAAAEAVVIAALMLVLSFSLLRVVNKRAFGEN